MKTKSVWPLATFVLAAWSAVPALATVPDNGFGTADMPIQMAYPGLTVMQISAGLPPASTIDLTTTMAAPTAFAEQPGGGLGGTQAAGAGMGFQWSMQGTGLLSGYSRNMFFALSGAVNSFVPAPPNAGVEINSAPRTPFALTQSYDTEIFRLFGQITGDPDFDLLRVVGGTDFGLPSPGHTILNKVGATYNVDSFYDLTYRIDFVGRNGGPFTGMSGSTTGTVRLQISEPVPEPSTIALLAIGGVVLAGSALRRRKKTAC